MLHLPILPILIPVIAGVLMLLPPFAGRLPMQRAITFIAMLLLLAACIALLLATEHQPIIYALGDWHPPFGIMLLADRLAAMLLVLTSFLALCALIYATGGDDKTGGFFYPLFMFQLMGVNGAFLTGDLFNLFVFFEVLLIASYALLIHGGGKEKTRMAFHYVTLNLLGSAFFLIALGTLYGTLGTLNMADMTQKVPLASPEEQAIAKAGGLMLLLVFGLKSAMLPLQFWLPRTYAAASAPVAALFAIMTKVGIYSIYRVFGGIFGDSAGELANIATAWIWPIGGLTIIVGMLGALAAPSLKLLTANMAIISVGTLLLTFVIDDGNALFAGLYYLVHSTLICGALFLIADMIQIQRGTAQDRFVVARPMKQAGILGAMFFVSAVAIVGLPPLSGFVGKALVLQTAIAAGEQLWVWSAILVSSLIGLVAFSRAGTALFWHVSGNKTGAGNIHPAHIVAVTLLLLSIPVLTVFAGPVTEFSVRAANDIEQSAGHIVQVINAYEGAEHVGH